MAGEGVEGEGSAFISVLEKTDREGLVHGFVHLQELVHHIVRSPIQIDPFQNKNIKKGNPIMIRR